MSDFLTAIPIAFILVISTGPVFFVILETSISKGIKHAIGVSVGAAAADVVFLFVAFLGASKLLKTLENSPQLYYIGGVVLICYGLISLKKTHKKRKIISSDSEYQVQEGGFFYHTGKGFLLNIINMGTFLFWMGSVVFFGAKFQMDDTRLFSFFAYIIVIYLVFDVIKIVLAKQLKSKLTPLFVYRIKQVVHIIIVLFGVFFIFQGTFPEQAQKLENRLENRLEDRLK